MAAVRGRDTKPELLVRQGLHRRGFRFRVNAKRLPGRPDLKLTKYEAVIFVHGCFWHMHDCPLFRWPKTRPEFWEPKLTANAERDRRNKATLKEIGWRVAVVWECALRGPTRRDPDEVIDSLAAWLSSGGDEITLRGRDGG